MFADYPRSLLSVVPCSYINVLEPVAILMDSFSTSISYSFRSLASCFVLRVHQALLYISESVSPSSLSTTTTHPKAIGHSWSSVNGNECLTISSSELCLWATTGVLIMVGCGALLRGPFSRRDSQASDMQGINECETSSMSSSASAGGDEPSETPEKRAKRAKNAARQGAFRLQSLIANRGK